MIIFPEIHLTSFYANVFRGSTNLYENGLSNRGMAYNCQCYIYQNEPLRGIFQVGIDRNVIGERLLAESHLLLLLRDRKFSNGIWNRFTTLDTEDSRLLVQSRQALIQSKTSTVYMRVACSAGFLTCTCERALYSDVNGPERTGAVPQTSSGPRSARGLLTLIWVSPNN